MKMLTYLGSPEITGRLAMIFEMENRVTPSLT